jgi:pimeloyl-ACP methyl ester carboxylesterase
MDLTSARNEVPAPDFAAAPEGFLVEIVPGERIHFLDWGGPPASPATAASGQIPRPPGFLLIHGLNATAWAWNPIARRIRSRGRTVALDLRGHGLSDAPTSGYTEGQLGADVVAVAEGSGLLGAPDDRLVLVGHGYGAIVAAWAAAELTERCAGLVLVDGGWEDIASETGLTPDEWLRDLEEPPEVLRSMADFLADRRNFDPASWDADQEQAARSTVVEVPAGRVVPAVRPHALAGSVEAIFSYDPVTALADLPGPVLAVLAATEDPAGRRAALGAIDAARAARNHQPLERLDLPLAGHNLMRYQPAELSQGILSIAQGTNGRRTSSSA